MGSVPQKIIEKIQKLLALSESPNEAEAACALTKAHNLLKQYNLEMADLYITEPNPTAASIISSTDKEPEEWHKALLSCIGRFNYCALLSAEHKGKHDLFYIGKPVNIRVCVEFGTYIQNVLMRNIKGLGYTTKVSKNSFCWGFAITLIERLELIHNTEMNADCRDLVVCETAANDAFIEQHFSIAGKTKAKPLNKIDATAYLHGMAEGSSMSINPQIAKAMEYIDYGR